MIAPVFSPAAPRAAHTPGTRVHLAELLAALSHALDLTDGQRPGHTLRTCLVGMRLADELGLGDADRAALYYTLLLKDAGCSSNAARMASLFDSDDQAVKPGLRAANGHSPVAMAVAIARSVSQGRPLAARLKRFVRVAQRSGTARELIQIRCERGAEIARRLGFPEATAAAIHSLDEHWSGGGHPEGLRGDAIPLLSRIALLAQTIEVFFTDRGTDVALRVARARRGTWFDPRLVDVVLRWRGDARWWSALRGPDTIARVVHLEPPAPGEGARIADEDELEEVARAFADIIDAKSPYTFHHSTNVAELARGAGRMLGLGERDDRRLLRAGLLHDIGKLGVSNLILDKPSALTAEERAAVELHPLYTWEILSRVAAFGDIARLAALHHERLDGSGYPWGVRADGLDAPARLLAVADIYEALTADRPYRAGMSPALAMAILRRERGTRLCATAIDALAAHVEEADLAAERMR
jgi:HD-GYP domain-containing protein (c-di-GMP phosphodiesterase class II)